MNAQTRMTRTRTRLLLDHPWFGSLAMRLQIDPDPKLDTVSTDGTVLHYSPDFVVEQTDAHLLTIMAHEVLHCALLHPFRRGSRDAERWNRATDYAVNADLKAAGFEMPPDALIDPQYAGLSADVIYAQLANDPNDEPDSEPRSTGTVDDAPDAQGPSSDGPGQPDSQPSSDTMTAEDWKIAAEQATATTRAAGTTPADAVRSTKAARQIPEDWRAILREFIEHTQPSDYSWASPNRRLIAEGLYLPGIVKENLGTIGLAIDTSGSVSAAVLAAFAAEVQDIVSEARPDLLAVVYCDSMVRHVEEFSADDVEIELSAKGGGGTRFGPALDYFTAMEQQPAAVLYFTDLENGAEQVEEPAYPVLWVTGKNVTKPAPFGPIVRIDANV